MQSDVSVEDDEVNSHTPDIVCPLMSTLTAVGALKEWSYGSERNKEHVADRST